MSKDLYVERLKQVPLFASLSKKELGMLLRQSEHLSYAAGRQLVREGAPGEELWLVIRGTLSVVRGGREVDRLGPGDVFGELAVIDPAPRDATVVADTDVEVVMVDRRHFWALVEEVPALSRKLLVTLARRLREADRRDSAARAG